MNHPIIEYWNGAFEEFKVGDFQFFSPEMPDPILSPHFLDSPLKKLPPYFNKIQRMDKNPPPRFEGYRVRNDFYLCALKINRENVSELDIRVAPLEFASSKKEHKKMLFDGFPQDFDFLENLERFLPKLRAKYVVSTLYENNQPAASVTMGISNNVAVLISGMVHTQFRNQKVSRKLKSMVHQIGADNGVEETFYWTKSERLLSYADRIDRYLVYVQDQ